MSAITDSSLLLAKYPPNPLDEADDEGLLRVTRLLEQLFQVPAAYLALFGSDLKVVRRLGSGREYWDSLRTFPLSQVVNHPRLWPDPDGRPAPGFEPGPLKFAASAPLRSLDGTELGLVVIADVVAHPQFKAKNLQDFAELASLLSANLELRTMACEAQATEIALQEAERRFRNIANAAPVLIIYCGADGDTVFVNRTWLDFTGRSFEEEVCAEGFTEKFHPDYRDQVMARFWDSFAARRPDMQEFPMRRRDGVYRWMQARGVPRFREDGVFAGYVGCLVDVTEERLARHAVQKQRLAAGALAQSAGLFYMILDCDGTIEDQGSGAQRDLRQHLLWEVCDGQAREVLREAFLGAVTRREVGEVQVSCSFPDGSPAIRRWTFRLAQGESLALMTVIATIQNVPVPGI